MDESPDNSEKPTPLDEALFAKFKYFAGLSREELAALLDLSGTVTYSTGQRILSAGDMGHCMYVILEGSVSVSADHAGHEVDLAILGAGDFFGEVALVDDGPRSANVTAIETCKLLTVTRMTLGVLAGLHPQAAIHILAAVGRSLVARLRRGNQKFLDLIMLDRQSAA